MRKLTICALALVFGVALAGSGWTIEFDSSDVRINNNGGTVSSDEFGLVEVDTSEVVAGWIDYRDGVDSVYSNYSTDNGANWQGSDTRLSTTTAEDVLVVTDGNYAYFGWVEDHYDIPDRRSDFAFRRLDPTTGTWTDTTFLDSGSYAENAASDISLAVGNGGVIYAAWKSYYHLVFSYSTDSGQTWSGPQQITTNFKYYPEVIADGNGDPLYIYGDQDFQPPSTFMVVKGNENAGTVTWAEPATVATIAGYMKVTADDANAYAFWWNNTDVSGNYAIYSTYSDDGGESFPYSDTELSGGGFVDKFTYSVGNDGLGNVFILWDESDRVQLRQSDDAGETWGSAAAMTAYSSSYPLLKMGDSGSGKMAITFEDLANYTVGTETIDTMICRYSGDSGSSWSGDLRVDGKVAAPDGDQRNQSVFLGSSYLFVVWREYRAADGGNNIYFNRATFNPTPTPTVTPEGFKTPSTTPTPPPTASPSPSSQTTPVPPTPVGGNLLENPGFESWTSETWGEVPDDWYDDWGVDIAKESGTVHSGNYSISFDNYTDPGSFGRGEYQSWVSPIEGGSTYTFSAWVYSQSPGTMGITGRWYSQTGYYTYWTSSAYSTTSGQWELLQVSEVAPALTATARVDIKAKNASLGWAGYADDASFYKGAAAPTPPPTPTPIPPTPPQESGTVVGDYNGDGTTDLAVYRQSAGLWKIRNVSNIYFGTSVDEPVPQDYDGDGAWDVAYFRPSNGLWKVRNITRIYFGNSTDQMVPADYDGNGTAEPAYFRPSTTLWNVRNQTRIYFGTSSDIPVPNDYNGDGAVDPTFYRGSNGLWKVRNVTSVYFGTATDTLVPADYNGDGTVDFAWFRPSNNLWKVKDLTRIYYGTSSDTVFAGDFDGDGTADLGYFRPSSILWKIKDVTRVYFGQSADTQVSNPYTK